MAEISEEDRGDAVEQVKGQRHAEEDNGHQGEDFADKIIARMVAGTGGGIHHRIAVVYEVEVPHPGHFVQHIVSDPLCHKIEGQHSHQ